MSGYLSVSVHFLSPWPTYHGCCGEGESEWPPSPLRLFQAIVASAADPFDLSRVNESALPTLNWLTRLPAPAIHSPAHIKGSEFRLSVPNNDLDVTAKLWWKGTEPEKPKRPIDLRTMKTVRPVHLRTAQGNTGTVHYLYPLPDDCSDLDQHLDILRSAARSITHLGWGIDMVAGNVEVLEEQEVAGLTGERWEPSTGGSGTGLRVPVDGTLNALIDRHERFLGRLSQDGFRPVPPLTKFKVVNYRRVADPLKRPFKIFHLINPDTGQPHEKAFSYPQARFIHIAAMVRHLAIEAMSQDRPRGTSDNWIDTYVAGHAKPGATDHRRFSYIPLPSIGHAHTDPSIRRVMITAPPGDEGWLDFLASRLVGSHLEPLEGTTLRKHPVLDLPRNQAVVTRYTGAANTWASVTPVILPGYNDRSPSKTQKLIDRALIQAGIVTPCEYEWREVSWFPKSLTAHKYDHHRNEIGYIRPKHLLNFSAVHLRITFKNNLSFPGPLAIGPGRHCGFGLFATHE